MERAYLSHLEDAVCTEAEVKKIKIVKRLQDRHDIV